jgi:hypothetical protein
MPSPAWVARAAFLSAGPHAGVRRLPDDDSERRQRQLEALRQLLARGVPPEVEARFADQLRQLDADLRNTDFWSRLDAVAREVARWRIVRVPDEASGGGEQKASPRRAGRGRPSRRDEIRQAFRALSDDEITSARFMTGVAALIRQKIAGGTGNTTGLRDEAVRIAIRVAYRDRLLAIARKST